MVAVTQPSRRGRPRAGEREQRQQRVLDAALGELVEHGYDDVTMLGIASRAGVSKETLYSWFGSRDGLFEALIRRNADASAARVRAALHAADVRQGSPSVRATLVGYATGLLSLLTSEGSVALNRAAMRSPRLAELLLRSGRHRIGPLVEGYLGELHAGGWIHAPDPPAAFRLLYGLVVQDTQIRVLLGERSPSSRTIRAHAAAAVDRFLRLCAMPR
jgi:AcrR family transcriptional regulator